MTIRICLTAVVLIFFVIPCRAQDTSFRDSNASIDRFSPRPGWNGNVRAWMQGGNNERDLQALYAEFTLKAFYRQGKTLFRSDIRLREGVLFDDRKTELEIKELYTGIKTDHLDVLFGNQIVCWGRTDGFNPTDNLHPNNYFFLSPESDDQKTGNLLLTVKAKTGNSELEIIGIPCYKPSEYRYDLFDMGEGVVFNPAVWPQKTFKNGSFAARFNAELPALGFSLSYFNGYDPFYGFSIDTISLFPSTDIRYKPSPYRKNTLGADLAVPVNKWIFRSEAALNLTKSYESNINIPYPDMYYVAGLERTVSNVTCILQYIGKYIIGFSPLNEPVLADPYDPAAMYQYATEKIRYESALFNRKIFHQQEKWNHAVSLTLSGKLAYERLEASLTTYYNITSDEWMVRPTAEWEITDGLSVLAGGSWMNGPDDSVFQKAGKVLNGMFAGMSIHF